MPAGLGAALLRASAGVDRAYRWFDRFRSEVVAALASDATLDRHNAVAYGSVRYRPTSGAFRRDLFPFEESALERFFPPPPARVLVGGAGGGREALALADRGYEVVAFDPVESLVHELAAVASFEVKQGSYADMDRLFPDRDTFDAALVGWGSFSHLRTREARVSTLRSFRGVTSGPILVSFLAVRSPASGSVARLRRLLPRRAGRDPGDVFAMSIGLYHPVDEEEVGELAAEADLRVLHLSFDTRETSWPHAVLQRAD